MEVHWSCFSLHHFLHFSLGLMCIKEMDAESLRSAEMPFSIPSATGHEVHLSHKYSRISPDNRLEYVKLAMDYRYVCLKLLKAI